MGNASDKKTHVSPFTNSAFGGLTRGAFLSIKDEIIESNRSLLVNSTAIGTILLALLALGSLFVPAISGNRLLYIGSTLCFFCTFLVSKHFCRKFPQITMPIWYVFFLLVMSLAATLGLLSPNIPATSFCVLLFALPLLLTEAPYKVSIILVLCTVAYCVATLLVKPPNIASLDVVNSLSFCLLSLVVNFYMARMKLNDVVRRVTITKQRDTDALSGVLSRNATELLIQRYLQQNSDPAAFAIIDADNFKNINDSHGHECGDKVIQSLAARMQAVFRQGDIIGRFGGDEFIVFMTQVDNPEDIDVKMEEMVDACHRPIQTPKGPLFIQVSVGISLYPLHGKTYDALFRTADSALYEAKALGKDQHVIASIS